MLQSKLFTKTRKEVPADEVAKNAQLLIRAGYIHKEMAGVYAYLPLGLRVLNNIEKIIREEMDAIGGQELQLTALQDKSLWEKTDRWDDEKVDNWFKTNISNGGETGLGITHEEPLTRIMTEYVSSYRDLPILAYQFQTKFRNELRTKSGIMRGREFLMKDMYSFARTEDEHKELYDKARHAYIKVFERLGLGSLTYTTFASGGIFSEFSEEFQTLSEVGEDTIYIDEEKGVAINKEVLTDENLKKLDIDKSSLAAKKSIETGNIFNLGTKFSETLGLNYKDEKGKTHPVIMGSYGIGLGRVMGTIAEILSDDAGLIWPAAVAPFQVHLLTLGDHPDVTKQAEDLKSSLESDSVSVLWDDRDLGPGEKFADADLLGLPLRVILSSKTMEAGNIEIKKRTEGKEFYVTEQEAFNGKIKEIISEM